MDINKQVEMFTENINEMLSSTIAVKGEAFGRAVAVNFESLQLMDMVDRLVYLTEDDAKDVANALYINCMNIVASMCSKMCDDISEKDLQEVLKMSSALNKRRNEAGAEILKGMGDA